MVKFNAEVTEMHWISGFHRLNDNDYYEDDYLGIPLNGKSLAHEYHDDPLSSKPAFPKVTICTHLAIT